MYEELYTLQFSRSVMSNSVTPWAMACQASLSVTNSRSLLKFMSLKSVMPSNHLILCCPLLLPSIFPSIRVFFSPVSQFFASGGHSIGASTSESVFPVNIQYWFPLGLTEASTWRRKWQPTLVFLPRESCGHRSLVGSSELDTTAVT